MSGQRPPADPVVEPDAVPAAVPAAVAAVDPAAVSAAVPAVEPAVDQVRSATSAAGMRTATTGGVVRAGALMAVATVVSRATGLLSKIAMLSILGASVTSSAYTVANTLPNIVFELLIGGVLTSVAIPLLTRAQRSDPDGGLEYTQRLLTIAAVGLLVATVLAVVCAPLLAGLYQGQHAGNAQLTTLTTQLGRLLLPQIFFYGIAALFGAILNTKERFAANAWAPVLNNVVVIAVAALLYADTHGRATLTHGLPARDLLILGIGTTLGIIVQAVVMVPSLLRSGFRFRWRWGWDPRLTEAGSLVGWAVGYVLLSQVGVVVTTRIANGAFADKSGTTIFSYASLLFQMPYGILGVAVLTAMMPRLARHAADGELAAVKDDVSLANRLSAVALLPVSAALLVLGGGLSVLLFEWGHVTRYVALQIGISIGALAIGLVPLAVTLVQMRVFYAMKDGRTPTAINAVMVAVRVPLLLGCAALAPRWVIPGLALATAVSYLVGAVVGEVWLRRRFGPMGSARTLRTIGQMALASAAGAAAAWAAVRYTVGLSPTTHLAAAVALAIGSAAGVLVIAAVAAALRVDELAPLWRRVARLARRGSPPSSVGVPDRQPEPPAMGESAGAAPTEQVRPSGSDPASSAGPAHQIGVVQFSNPTRGPSREQVDQRVRQPGADDPRDDTPPHDALVPPVDPQGAMGGSAEQGAPVQAGDSTVETAGSAEPQIAPDSQGPETVPATAGRPPAGSDPLVELAPGATIGGRYRLVNLIATDDSGNRFWRAKDTVLPRDMAVTLLPDTSATSATVARTLRVGRLHHIGLPQTLDLGSELGQSYVVGQWVDGATLTDLLSGGPLEPEVATSITAKVSEAVAEAHRNGIALGAINPSLVRVNFDGQVRLSHVIAHGSATPDQDIRAVGGLLYLMLTGTWPLTAGAVGAASDVRPGAPSTGGQLPPAPTRLGREVPAAEVRAGVPTALSALAERALHPEDPAGIHAVGAIAALLRQPEVSAASAPPPPDEPQRPTLNPAERRLIKERRVKLGIATVMIAAFSALIIIVVASLAKQVMSDIAGPTVTGVQILDAGTSIAPAPKPTTAVSSPKAQSTTVATGATSRSAPSTRPTTPAAPVATVQKILDATTVYDPMGDGVKDNTDQVPLAFDGNPQTFWSTFVYRQQFPSALKPGVGLTLTFANPITATSVTVSSDTPDTTIEIRTAAGPDLPYTQTTALAQGTISSGTNAAPGSVTIPLVAAPLSKYLVVFVVHMAADGSRYRSDINEISVSGS